MEQIHDSSFGECIKLANDTVEVIITKEVGPRIIRYALLGEENILAELPDAELKTSLGTWKPYGGHRLWVAPEVMPNTYYPDNAPVEIEEAEDGSIIFISKPESENNLQKKVTVQLHEGSHVTIEHSITNTGDAVITMAPWALTIMRGGGRVIIPQEPFISHDDYLLPARPLVLWYFTNLTDPRITLGKYFVQLRTEEHLHDPQKIGVLNKQGWAAYHYKDQLFVKTISYIENRQYPDYNSNTEAYTAGTFMELESLGPLEDIEPLGSVTHKEEWSLFNKVILSNDEEAMLAELNTLLPKVLQK